MLCVLMLLLGSRKPLRSCSSTNELENTNDVVISPCDGSQACARAGAAANTAIDGGEKGASHSRPPPPPENGFSDRRDFMVSSSVFRKFTADFETGSTVGLAAISLAMPPASIDVRVVDQHDVDRAILQRLGEGRQILRDHHLMAGAAKRLVETIHVGELTLGRGIQEQPPWIDRRIDLREPRTATGAEELVATGAQVDRR